MRGFADRDGFDGSRVGFRNNCDHDAYLFSIFTQMHTLIGHNAHLLKRNDRFRIPDWAG